MNLAVLIATKDRYSQLLKLFESISASSFLPTKVVVVYSGEDITSLATSFREKLNILFRSKARAYYLHLKS